MKMGLLLLQHFAEIGEMGICSDVLLFRCWRCSAWVGGWEAEGRSSPSGSEGSHGVWFAPRMLQLLAITRATDGGDGVRHIAEPN